MKYELMRMQNASNNNDSGDQTTSEAATDYFVRHMINAILIYWLYWNLDRVHKSTHMHLNDMNVVNYCDSCCE